MKKLIKRMLIFALVLISMMNTNYKGIAYAETINIGDYIKDIKIMNSNGGETNFFNGYEVKDGVIILKITEDIPLNGFWDPNKGHLLQSYNLIIDTINIESIRVDNPAVRVAGGVEYRGVKDFNKTADEWRTGIPLVDMGFVHPNGKSYVVFDKDAPPTFTFVTVGGQEFELTWEAIKVDKEPLLRLTVRADQTTAQVYDPSVSAGFADGKNYKELKIGEKANITAYDGYKSFFNKWRISGMDDNKFKELIGTEKTARNIEFEITKDFFDVEKNDKLNIEAYYKTYAIIDTTETDEERGEVITKVKNRDMKTKDGFPLADKKDNIEFKAIPKTGYAFDKWEFITPGVVGENTMNPDVNLNSPDIEIKLPHLIAGFEPENNYHLRVKAIFKEKTREIKEIYNLEDEEFIQGYDKYQLPKTVKVKYDDDSEGLEIINWGQSIETAELGENTFTGTVADTDKTVEIKVTMKKIIGINEEDQIQEVTIYNDEHFGEYRIYHLPTTVRVKLNDNSEKIINIKKWEGEDVATSSIKYYEHRTYEAEGIIEGFDEKIKFILNVKKESEKDKLKINFNTKGGSIIPPTEIEKGQKLTKPTDPIKAGYKFIGWYSDEDLTEEFDFNTLITENITLYAKWEEEATDQILEITSVELIKDGKVISKGTINGRRIILELPEGYDESIIEGNHILKITGTKGTNLAQDRGYDGSIEEWANGRISNSIMIGEPKKFTLYKGDNSIDYTIEIVKTSKMPEYTITFNTMGGSTISPIKVKEGETIPIPKEPTKEGYKFAGWYKDVLYRYEYDFNTIVKDDRELFAKWEKADKPTPKPGEKQEPKITSFTLLGVPGHINHSRETIDIFLPFTVDLDYLVPDIKYEGDELSPSIGKPQNFNRTVYYTVSATGYNSKTYKVYVDMPRDRYDRYDRHIYYEPENWYRPLPGSSKGKENKDWYEISQEIKKKRLEEEEKPSLNSPEVKKAAFKEVGRITAQSGSAKRDLSIKQGNDHMEIKLNPMDKNDSIKNQINIPAGVLNNINELGFDYLKYNTSLVRIKIFPFMDSADGLYLNIKPAPSEKNNDIQYIWAKTKGAGKMFQIETNSTKAGLSFEMKLDKNLPREHIRVVKYNYMKGKFEDISPDKWSIINGHVYVEQVSDGIYGIIYKK